VDRPGHAQVRAVFRGAGFAGAPIIRVGTIHDPHLAASSTPILHPASTALDGHGKTLSHLLLALELPPAR